MGRRRGHGSRAEKEGELSIRPPELLEARVAWFCIAVSFASPASGEMFVDVAAESGLEFRHDNGMTGERHFFEIMGPGSGLFDADGDGDLDAYLIQGAGEQGDRLFRNDPDRGPHFTDVTDEVGLTAHGYGMGLAVSDIDGDGLTDIYVTNFGANQLWQRRLDDTYADITIDAGAGDDRWSTSAAFVDIDMDGLPDLFVGNYVDFSLASSKPCYSAAGVIDYCSPLSFDPEPNRLLRNLGNGHFVDITISSGIAAAYYGALGVIATDVDMDGFVDLYVANDGRPNLLWRNQGDGHFIDDGLFSGTAVNGDGAAEASMGIHAADFDGDGDEDLFMTHIDGETNTLFRNEGEGLFTDDSFDTGIGLPSRGLTGFGVAWLDIDNDSWLDLLIANGAVYIDEEQFRAGDPLPLRQRNQLLRNVGGHRFVDVTDSAGKALGLLEVSRGVATGDIDDDGDADVLIANNHGPSRLLQNQTLGSGWIGFQIIDQGGQALMGSRLQLQLDDGRDVWRSVRTAASYCSSNDPRILVGLGSSRVLGGTLLLVGGRTQPLANTSLVAGQYHTITVAEP